MTTCSPPPPAPSRPTTPRWPGFRSSPLSASLEPVSGFLVRVHGPGGRLGDGYSWCVTAVPCEGGGVELKGMYGAPTADEALAVEEALRRAGFRWRQYTHNGRRVRKPL